MSLFRPASMFRAPALRPLLSTVPRARLQVRQASQDYGSGEGNPAGEKPQQQGKNRSENLEHPGPPPPKVAQGQSSSSPNSPDQADSKGSSSKGSNKSPSSESKGSSSSKGSSKSSDDVRDQSDSGAKPKILEDVSPANENSEDVKQHNKEMSQRADKAHEKI